MRDADAVGVRMRSTDGSHPQFSKATLTTPEQAMKTRIIATAIALTAFGLGAYSAGARAADSQLRTVTVHPTSNAAKGARKAYTLDCTPPNSAQECGAFHQAIRHNFSNREIGMLFGAATAYPEARSGYSRVAERYDNFARAYDQSHLTAFAQ